MGTTTDTSDLLRQSGVALAGAIARGEVSAAEAVEASIARIEQVNPALNAVVVQRYAEARAEARAADERRARGEPLGPLHGVPVTIKESLDLAGTPSTYGLPSRANILTTQDDVYVARLRAAGAIVVGKTNVAQLLLYIESDNPLYGRTNNPWNLERTPGGSSGGQAAIVAAGGAPLGLATDIGGSIRVPATFCGIAGMKPTADRTPDLADFGISLGERAVVSQAGALARHVEDVALTIELINGGRAPNVEPPAPLGDYTTVDVSKLRVAYYADDGSFPVAATVRRAVVEAAGMLAGRGAQVVEWRPPDVAEAQRIFFGALGGDGGRGPLRLLGKNKRDPRIASLITLATAPRPVLATLGGALWLGGQRNLPQLLRYFGHTDTAYYWGLVEAQAAYQRRFADALDRDDGGPFDVIICPACALPALPHGASADLVTAGAYATLYNVLGYPTGVVPVTRVRADEEQPRKNALDVMVRAARRTEIGSAGLPVGVQVVARPWREHVALAAMRAIEADASARSDYPAQAPV